MTMRAANAAGLHTSDVIEADQSRSMAMVRRQWRPRVHSARRARPTTTLRIKQID